VVAGHTLYFSPTATAVAGAGLCFALRLMAIFRGWRLPIARPRNDELKGWMFSTMDRRHGAAKIGQMRDQEKPGG
jgi:hypothetical protein